MSDLSAERLASHLSGGRVIRSPSKPSAMPKGMLSAAMSTASATDASEKGRGAR